MPLAIFNSLSFCNSDCDLDVDCGEGFVSTGQDSTLSQDVMVWGLKTPIIVLTHNKEQEQCYNSDDCGLFSHKETNFLAYVRIMLLHKPDNHSTRRYVLLSNRPLQTLLFWADLTFSSSVFVHIEWRWYVRSQRMT